VEAEHQHERHTDDDQLREAEDKAAPGDGSAVLRAVGDRTRPGQNHDHALKDDPRRHGADDQVDETGPPALEWAQKHTVEKHRGQSNGDPDQEEHEPHVQASIQEFIPEIGGQGHERAVGDVQDVADTELHGEPDGAE